MRASDLDDHLGFWLRKVSNHVTHSFTRKLDAKEVTAAEWVVMRGLFGRPPTAPSRLAQQVGITRGAVTKLADRLLEKSLVARRADSGDGRAQTLALTSRGNKLVPELAALADQNDSELFGCLTALERKTLGQLLKKLVEANQITTTPTE